MSAPDIDTLDATRLELLYAELEKPMYNVVYRWLWNSAEAQDVVQDAFIKVWRMRTQVDMTTVRPLLYKVAVNLASNRRRSRKLWKLVSLDAVRARPSDAGAADELLEGEQTRASIQRAIDGLPEKYRRVIALCELSDLTYEQIAGILGIAVGTVGSRRNTALSMLRDKLGPLEDETDDGVETRSV